MNGKVWMPLFLLLATSAWAQQTPPVAVIDVQRVVEESAAGREAMGRLRKLQEDKVTQGRKLSDELAGLRRQLETQAVTLSEAKIAELRKQIEDKQVELQRFQDDAQQDLEEARAKELQNLEKQIMPIINEIGREKKFLLIFNKFQSGLVYADDAVDITDEVLRRFNTKLAK
ncbi:MAG: OmpH family outer membrane protein [Thermoanaerobaculum sp.]|nr:OmpH family outer membrane protein [Thermoanaerobaculum sp.]MCX7895431.1 OmpH family outer membrane protein [Thermoanaerobaculum sp.]MDW7967088.1 OmpH family outer membrane protein [Thermoanaerobaculum sp.]